MGLKNINILEQHVEKIVLGVAGAGALFLIYMSLQTVTIPDLSVPVGPRDIEPQIQAQIKIMEEKRDELDRAGPPSPQVPPYLQDYMKIASAQPLDQRIVNLTVPPFAPRNIPPKGSIEVPPNMAAVVPKPVGPEALRGEVLQLQVSPAVQLGANGQPVAVMAPQVKNVVVLDGYVPVGEMELQMLQQTDPLKRFPPNLQRGLVYRVSVRRQELQPNGVWSKLEPVSPAKGSKEPDDPLLNMNPGGLENEIPTIEAQLPLIQLPQFYWDAQGLPVQPPILSRPIPDKIQADMNQLNAKIEAAQRAPGAFVPVVGAPGVAGANAWPASDLIKNLKVQPFTFWDESVLPDHTYRYYVQIQLVNPGYKWQAGLAKSDTELKEKPVIFLDYAVVPGLFTVHSDLAMFIQGVDGGDANRIKGQIYHQVNGRWWLIPFVASKGMSIGGVIDKLNPPQEVDTKYTVVDIKVEGKNVHVVLKDPSGNLVTRDTVVDWNRPEKLELYDKVNKANETAATMAATAPGITLPTIPVIPTPTPTPVPDTPTSPPATRRGTLVPTRG